MTTKKSHSSAMAVGEDSSIYTHITGHEKTRKLAFVRHIDSMDLRSVNFKVHKTFECDLRTSIAGKWASLARLDLMVPVEVAL